MEGVAYDYLLVALGSDTAFYGIPGLAERAHTLKSVDDALTFHEAVAEAGAAWTPRDPARLVVGGADRTGRLGGRVCRRRKHGSGDGRTSAGPTKTRER